MQLLISTHAPPTPTEPIPDTSLASVTNEDNQSDIPTSPKSAVPSEPPTAPHIPFNKHIISYMLLCDQQIGTSINTIFLCLFNLQLACVLWTQTLILVGLAGITM